MSAKLLPLALLGLMSAIATAQTPPTQAADDDDLIGADRPGIADSSSVIGRKHFQIETGVTYEKRRSPDGVSWDLLTPVLLRVGVNAQWEVRFETNGFGYLRQEDGSVSRGFSPISFGFKYHFQDSKGPKKPSLGVIGRIFPASGSSAFASTMATYDVRLSADWDFAPQWTLNPNVGWASYEDASAGRFSAFLGAVTLNYAKTSKLSYFFDTAYQSPEGKFARPSLIFDAGVAWITGKDTQWDISIGQGAAGDSPARPFVAFGFCRRF